MTCHNEIHGGVADLTGKSLTPLHMRDDPLIYPGCVM